ncbi:hypothetical protein [Sphingomonas sp. Leaf226]|uniref:hypothetical protein n=1 Tax=Sphingomonas sp. Leaf226 TaxID=1735691 RepID=UPI000B16A5DA|nr:hypothetical protein [Sphingomonas sp. Leaf226]
MENQVSKSDDLCQDDRQHQVANPSPQPFLRMRPQSFFSNKFDLEIVEGYSKADAEARLNEGKDWLSRLMELNLLLLIVLVGVPVLVYCVLSSAL